VISGVPVTISVKPVVNHLLDAVEMANVFARRISWYMTADAVSLKIANLSI
jgi:hypothetical protein